MSVATSGVWPRVVPVAIAPIWMARPNTCAIGRNSSVEHSVLNRLLRPTTTWVTSPRKLAWVSSQPFGRPVVPEV